MMRSNSIPGWTSILPMRRCCCATLERKIYTLSLLTSNEWAIHCVADQHVKLQKKSSPAIPTSLYLPACWQSPTVNAIGYLSKPVDALPAYAVECLHCDFTTRAVLEQG